MPAESAALAGSRQLLLVLAPEWESSSAHLFQYERASPAAEWQLVQTIPVSVGAKGLAWGKGLHGPPTPGVPEKREGDLKSPAGLFALGTAFGYAPARESTVQGYPYRQLTENTFGIEDPRSQHYNTIVDRPAVVQPDWQAAEPMLRPDGLYRYGVFVKHNEAPGPQEPALGSCIFLHGWRGPGQGTAGCTALPLEKMAGVLGWLREDAQPRLVQLTRAEYLRVGQDWGLPRVPEPPSLLLTLIGAGAILVAAAAFLWSRRQTARREVRGA